MSKIYSRPRIRIPIFPLHIKRQGIPSGRRGFKFRKFKTNFRGLNNPQSLENKKKVIKILTIIIISITTSKIALDAVTPIFDAQCIENAKRVATIASNEQATKVMAEHSYDELFTIEKDSQGNVTMIKTNVIPINQIISDVPIKIQEQIDENGKENIKITLGSFTGVRLFVGIGPSIPIEISCVGNVKTDLKSEFIAQGINQTLHRIYLQVDCEMSVLNPFRELTCNVSNQVLLMENVIVGNVPNTYYNLEGLNGKSDVLKITD